MHAFRLFYKKYFGEIKNEPLLKSEAQNLAFLTTTLIRLGDRSNESSYQYDRVNIRKPKCTMRLSCKS